MKISLIAAFDKKGGLGKDNKLLCYLPNDLKYFKKTTLNKPIIMGYNTFLSIAKALPDRRNIVITSKKNLELDNIEVVASIDEALTLCANEKEVMIIGGVSVYKQFLSKADKLYLTKIDNIFDADVFFPEIDWSTWRKISSLPQPVDKKNVYPHTFEVWCK